MECIQIIFQASDRGRPSLENVCTIAVKIEDINDNSPIFDRAGYDIPVAQVNIGLRVCYDVAQ